MTTLIEKTRMFFEEYIKRYFNKYKENDYTINEQVSRIINEFKYQFAVNYVYLYINRNIIEMMSDYFNNDDMINMYITAYNNDDMINMINMYFSSNVQPYSTINLQQVYFLVFLKTEENIKYFEEFIEKLLFEKGNLVVLK
jgi:hypothetical protein